MSTPVVTISAPYGTGGGIIGPAVAEQLGVSFLDRAIPTSVARALAVPEKDALAHDERTETRIDRLLRALAAGASHDGWIPEHGAIPTERAYIDQTERVLREATQSGGCVILGRGAVIVLRDHPTALHVCLCGSLDRRVRQAATLSEEDEASVRKLVEDTDRTRSAYFRHFYRADPGDSRLYHLVINSTLLNFDTCAKLIVTAAASPESKRPVVMVCSERLPFCRREGAGGGSPDRATGATQPCRPAPARTQPYVPIGRRP